MGKRREAALRLHRYLETHHLKNDALVGPDPGIRFNYRMGRFLKSALPKRFWGDDLCYQQGQGYWVLSNWLLHRLTRKQHFRDIAVNCSRQIIAMQRADGAWDYPNPEWRGRVATVEGVWASLGLLETFRNTAETSCLESVLRWHRYLVDTIGFQSLGGELSVNYFANRIGARVPNNSATGLRFFTELAETAQDEKFAEPCSGLLHFLANVQKPSGEFPYAVPGVNGGKERKHFQCYQYNAFECISLAKHYQHSKNPLVLAMIQRLLGFLKSGLSPRGGAFYQCDNNYRFVTYHAAALGAAFLRANALGIGGFHDLAARAFAYVLTRQRPEGDFPHSTGDYRFLSDRQCYPRYLTMILLFLAEADLGDDAADA